MDHSWCPVCDRHVFALGNLYCSEACRRKDAASSSPVFDISSKEQFFYEFPRCSAQKPFQSPYTSPNSSPVCSPLLPPEKDYFVSRDYYHSKDHDLSASPSTRLYNGDNLSPPKFILGISSYFNSGAKLTNTSKTLPESGSIAMHKKSNFVESARQLFFF